MTNETTIAALATMPNRVHVLKDMVKSILPQVDGLKVYLNGHKTVPRFLNKPKIEVFRNDRNIGDSGKFYWAEKHKGYYFSLDDDLILPPDYVQAMKDKIEGYNRKAVVGYHGRILNRSSKKYHGGSHKVLHWRNGLHTDLGVHLLGTGLLAFHSDTIEVNMSDFLPKFINMADIHFAIIAQRQRVPMIAIESKAGWIEYNRKMNGIETIFDERKNSDYKEVHRLRTWRRWKIHRV